MTDLTISIHNCNSINEGVITLRQNSLNIKYGPNGTGKSTIARALALNSEDDGSIEELTPFIHRSVEDGPRPSIVGAESIRSAMIFNEEYVSQFVFQSDEVLKDSFEVFINTEEYKKGNDQIESIFEDLKNTFDDEDEFNDAINGFIELRDAFNITKTGAVAKSSKGLKGLGVGGKLTTIPEELQGYEEFLHSSDPAGWITWQAKGKSYLEVSGNCPFCAVPDVDRDRATKLSEEYDSAAVRHMSHLRGVIDRLGRYLSPATLENIHEITTSISGVTSEQESFLVRLRNQAGTFLEKLSILRGLSFHALKEAQDIPALVTELKIDLKYLSALDSSATQSVVHLINGKLDEVATRINDVQREVGQQKHRVKRLIETNQASINAFLKSAGYRYEVRIEPSGESYRMLLEHQDAPGHLEAASSHLSYGEKNAFAMVLFMHDVQHKEPDLVVLDDPVSSFDKTKKFAILNQLFRGNGSLRGHTTLLLTHDIEPAIDIVRTSRRFESANPVVHFLSSKSGELSEKIIHPEDIMTFSQVCDENIRDASDWIIKCIYLRRRLEMHGDFGDPYEVLSSALHAREYPTRKLQGGDQVPLDTDEIQNASERIRERIPEFSYEGLVMDMRRPGFLRQRFEATSVGYEKVQLFRIMLEVFPEIATGDETFRKFINESYHIENEYVMQLNPRDFDAVPEFVVDECVKIVENANSE